MNRRRLLTRSGTSLAAVLALSGCTEETLEEAETKPPFLEINGEELDLPVNQRADVLERGVLEAADAAPESLDDFEAFLEDRGIDVESLSEVEKLIEEKLEVESEHVDVVRTEPHGEGPVLELEYVHPENFESGALYGVGLVAGGYATLLEAGNGTELLEATVLDGNRRPFGSFHVLAAWADEYNDGVTTARVYGSKPWMSAASE